MIFACLTFFCIRILYLYVNRLNRSFVNPFFPTVPTFDVRETASLGIMGAPRVPPLNPSETIVLSEHYRL